MTYLRTTQVQIWNIDDLLKTNTRSESIIHLEHNQYAIPQAFS